MVQRSSQEVQFQTGNGVQVAGGAGGMANPDYNKHRVNRDRAALDQGGETSSDRLLSNILGAGIKLLDQSIEISKEEAYLRGAAAAGTTQSEDELEANPMTRAWAKAGYRDTIGRVAIAENEAKIMADMPKLRERSPDEFNAYMAENRAALLPSLEGMSRKQRQGAMQNLLLNDRAAIKKHTTEHMKYQMEVELRSVQSANRIKVAALSASKDSAPAYITASQAAFSTAQSSILNNSKLPDSAKAKLIGEFAEFALADDHQQLYEMIQSAPVDLPDGTTGPMSSMLSWDDSVKLSKVYRESRSRTEQYRSLQYLTVQARKQADWDSPDAPLEPEADVLAFREEGIRLGYMTADQGKAFMQDYYKSGAKKVNAGARGAAWAAGNSGELAALGATDEEGAQAWTEKFGKNLSPAERTAELMKIGLVKGRPVALRMLGKEITPALVQLGLNPEMDAGNRDSLAVVLQTLDAAEKAGNGSVYTALMESMSQDQQAKLMDFRENLRSGATPAVAIAQTMNKMAEYSKMSPEMRKVMGEGNAKDDLELLTSMVPRTLLSTIGLGAASIFSKDAGNALATRTRASWYENEERVAEVAASMKYAAADELRVLSQTHPFMTKEARHSTVLATLRSRTVDTRDGPVLVPRGTTLQAFFGVSASTGSERVAAAIDEFIQPQEGNRLAYTVANGKLMFKELNKNAELVRDGFIDPKQVGPMVETQRKREESRFKDVHGAGRTDKGVTFNGDNTHGIDNTRVFNMRQSLINSGTYTMTGQRTPDEAKAASNEFKLSTNNAAKVAEVMRGYTGKTGQVAFTFFAELAVRTEGKFASDKQYKPLMNALRGQADAPTTLAALKETPVYKLGTPAERTRLESELNQILKGM